jgi:hypothetical protein
MGYKRNLGRNALCVALLFAVEKPSIAAPKEPLIVTPLGEPKLTLIKLRGAEDQDSGLDDAIESFGRAIDQEAAAQEQATKARCLSKRPASASRADRFAWEASCRYTRR